MPMITRRAALLGVVAASVAQGAAAAIPSALSSHPGLRAWTRPAQLRSLPLQEIVETDTGPKRLIDWLGRRPAVLALWASWCGPCLIEKPYQAELARRLSAVGASARIFALQAYDDVSLAQGRRALDRVGAQGLPSARASPGVEDGFRRVLGANRANRNRTELPSVFLIGGDGLEIGRAIGAMTGEDGRTDYWRDEATFDFLSRLL
jgi:thiol-disulfide isomerase/thioredoxin